MKIRYRSVAIWIVTCAPLIALVAAENVSAAWPAPAASELALPALPAPPDGAASGALGIASAPAAATLVAPGGTIVDTQPAYAWKAVAKATHYYLLVQDAVRLPRHAVWYDAAELGCASGAGRCAITPADLALPNGAYRWWVLTWNADGYGPWSLVKPFVVAVKPDAASLHAPRGTIGTLPPTYAWEAVFNTAQYRLLVRDAKGATKLSQWLPAADAHCPDGSGDCWTAPAKGLPPGVYDWQLQTRNATGIGPWSARFAFTVSPDMATAPLNDTGILTCADWRATGPCPLADYPNQDAQSGRDLVRSDDRDGHAGFSFVKLDAAGKALPASATAWVCVRDKITGLDWEIKTDDGGLRDADWRYTWYNPDAETNGGVAGTPDGGNCGGGIDCDTASYVAAVNTAGLCGKKDWRLPNPRELLSIVSNDRYPAIDTAYFPDLDSGGWFWGAWGLFWSSSSNAYDTYEARNVYFGGNGAVGSSGSDSKGYAESVRLVRGGQ